MSSADLTIDTNPNGAVPFRAEDDFYDQADIWQMRSGKQVAVARLSREHCENILAMLDHETVGYAYPGDQAGTRVFFELPASQTRIYQAIAARLDETDPLTDEEHQLLLAACRKLYRGKKIHGAKYADAIAKAVKVLDALNA